MKFMATWNVRPGCVKEAVGRFMAGKGALPEGQSCWDVGTMLTGAAAFRWSRPTSIRAL